MTDKQVESQATMFLIPSGETGEKYVKIISGDETMTVERYGKEMGQRIKNNMEQMDNLIESLK